MCFRSRLAEFEAESDANPLLLHISHFSRPVRAQKALTRRHKNTQKKNTHFLTTERRLAEWFLKSTAHQTWRHTTVLQAVFARHFYFGVFWVAPHIIHEKRAQEICLFRDISSEHLEAAQRLSEKVFRFHREISCWTCNRIVRWRWGLMGYETMSVGKWVLA